ncbi:MAG: hypothetical protein R3C58_13205 [Parvularculaceae bacterium]
MMWIGHDGHAALLRLSQSANGSQRRSNQTPPPPRAARKKPAPTLIQFMVSDVSRTHGEVRWTVNGERIAAFAARHGDGLRVWHGARHWDISFP